MTTENPFNNVSPENPVLWNALMVAPVLQNELPQGFLDSIVPLTEDNTDRGRLALWDNYNDPYTSAEMKENLLHRITIVDANQQVNEQLYELLKVDQNFLGQTQHIINQLRNNLEEIIILTFATTQSFYKYVLNNRETLQGLRDAVEANNATSFFFYRDQTVEYGNPILIFSRLLAKLTAFQTNSAEFITSTHSLLSRETPALRPDIAALYIQRVATAENYLHNVNVFRKHIMELPFSVYMVEPEVKLKTCMPENLEDFILFYETRYRTYADAWDSYIPLQQGFIESIAL